jgi:thiamine-phosphate pyrophosphorylase
MDMPIKYAREVLGPDALIGITASSLSLALQAEQAGADYIGFGPIFKTRSKDNPLPEKGLEPVLEVCNLVQIPVIAIAGITPGRVPDLIRVGAHGVAVMSAVSLDDDPRKATEQFVKAFESVSPRV